MKNIFLALFLVILTACGGVSAPAPSSHTISGTISGVSPAQVVLINAQNVRKLTVSDADGHYSFYALDDNTYTIAVTAHGYTYNPPSITFILTADTTGVDFIATPIP